jgi:hypothetical protein
MSTPKVRSLQASVHGFYTNGGFFKFTGGGTYLIRHPLMRRFKFKYSTTYGYTLRVPNHIQLGSAYELHAWWSRHLEELTEYRWTNCEPHGTASTGITFDYSFATAMSLLTTTRSDDEEYGMETDGFTDENDDGVIATLDDNERVLTTTFTSSAHVTSPVVAATPRHLLSIPSPQWSHWWLQSSVSTSCQASAPPQLSRHRIRIHRPTRCNSTFPSTCC